MIKLFKKTTNRSRTPDDRRIYAIGDIHGRLDLLERLLEKIDAHASGICNAQLVFLGDYVDRGPESKGVIERLVEVKAASPDTVFLKGNHEAAMLGFMASPATGYNWLDWGADETLRSYGVTGALTRTPTELASALTDALPAAHLAFFNVLTLTHRLGDYLFVHAGIQPGVAMEHQVEEDLLWIRDRFHAAAPDERPDFTVVHGHHPTDKPVNEDWRIGVDTGAGHSGRLTAVCLQGARRSFLSV